MSETESRRDGRMSRIRPQTSVVPAIQGLALWPDSSNNLWHVMYTSDRGRRRLRVRHVPSSLRCSWTVWEPQCTAVIFVSDRQFSLRLTLRINVLLCPYSLTILELRFLPAHIKSCPCVLQKNWAKPFYYKEAIISSLSVCVNFLRKIIRFYYFKKNSQNSRLMHFLPNWNFSLLSSDLIVCNE